MNMLRTITRRFRPSGASAQRRFELLAYGACVVALAALLMLWFVGIGHR